MGPDAVHERAVHSNRHCEFSPDIDLYRYRKRWNMTHPAIFLFPCCSGVQILHSLPWVPCLCCVDVGYKWFANDSPAINHNFLTVTMYSFCRDWFTCIVFFLWCYATMLLWFLSINVNEIWFMIWFDLWPLFPFTDAVYPSLFWFFRLFLLQFANVLVQFGPHLILLLVTTYGFENWHINMLIVTSLIMRHSANWHLAYFAVVIEIYLLQTYLKVS